ncbi:MAG: xanthine dehydrogenase small subunit [Granulosicoccus sp.]
MVRFLHNQELVELEDVPCDQTVLEWLRLDRGETGTKEGCGSGDCGACTVVIATVSLDDSGTPQLQYQSINSCITFIGCLHATQLLTVEHLANGDVLHPVQQAMVDQHGSQCGFCTPGIIMSLFALYQSRESTERQQQRIDRALGGNLCRCTGYRPIRQAAVQALEFRNSEDASASDEIQPAPGIALSAVNGGNSAQPLINPKSADDSVIKNLIDISSTVASSENFHQPHGLKELARLYQENPDYRLLGGGTDMALEVTQSLQDLPGLIQIARVPELNRVEISGKKIQLGAGVTVSKCLQLLPEKIHCIGEFLLRFGSDQIRNQATVGGNLASASPIGDLPPLFMALGAELTLQRGEVQRRIPIDDFFTGYRQNALQPGEFIVSVEFSVPADGSTFAVHKISKRRDDDISSVCLALHLNPHEGLSSDVRLAFGGMAATPVRALQTEAALENMPFDNRAVSAAQRALVEELQPISDARASASYRAQVAQNLLQRILMEATLS